MIGVLVSAHWIPEAEITTHHEEQPSVFQIMRRPSVLAFLSACFLMAAAHGVYYNFYSIFLVDHGYSKTMVGWFWAIGVVCEIAVFLLMPKLTRLFGLRNILLASFLIAAVRFAIIGWAVDVVVLVFLAQTMHAATFGSFHAVSVEVMHRIFHGKHHARGQAIYTSVSYGMGGTAGGLLSGWMWDTVGPQICFSLSSFAGFFGFLLLWRWLKLGHHND